MANGKGTFLPKVFSIGGKSMVITNSEVSMASKSNYTSSTKVDIQTTVNPTIVLGKVALVGIPEEKGESKNKIRLGDENNFMSSLNYALKENGEIEQVGDSSKGQMNKSNYQVRIETMSYLLRLLLLSRIFGEENSFQDLMSGSMEEAFSASNTFIETTTVNYEYSETQEVSFSSTGTAITADGRELSFNYAFAMSESFSEKTSIEHVKMGKYIDPLVINLDCNPTAVADQKFYFDLDGDGEDDEINNLKEGSYFLAFDRNEDGRINNGLELFGARTGDGFSELEEFDEDKNGWIDEADSIYKKLRVWSIDENGNEELYGLKESNVGAIYLGRIDTDFVNHDDNHEATAAVRKSGIFLRESDGSASGIQHVDFAT